MSKVSSWVGSEGLKSQGFVVRRDANNYVAQTTERVRTEDGKRLTVHKDVGIVIPGGIIIPQYESSSKGFAIIREYGFSQACLERVSLRWKNALGRDWFNVFLAIIGSVSNESFLLDYQHSDYQHRSLGAQKKSFEADIGMRLSNLYDLFGSIRLVIVNGEHYMTEPTEAQKGKAIELGLNALWRGESL